VQFKDLEPCRYHDGPFDPTNWHVPLLAIGWLEYPTRFNQGDSPDSLASRIRTLNSQAANAFFLFSFMGLHNCSFCAANDPHSSELPASSSNLFIPGNSVVFVAPGRIDHYIEAHSYLPPKQFITAVLTCPDLHSDEYREALRVSNAGVEAPLWGFHTRRLTRR
jgi:hypothetical protein